ncbi:MAG: CHC2 zinc finger domain-containing protein, partial [bacterium]
MSLLPRYPAPSEIAAGLGKPHAHGDGFMACCPAHDDSNPSLSLSPGKNGLTVWKCFAGCSQADVQDALHGLGLWPSPSSGGPARRQPR